MQRGHHAVGPTSRVFDGKRFHRHVQRGLGGPVRHPATEPVVVNAANPSRQYGEHGPGAATHKGQEVLRHDGRPDRIHPEYVEHPGTVNIAQRLFRLKFNPVQDPGRNDDEIKRPIRGHSLRSGRDTRIVQQIERSRTNRVIVKLGNGPRQRLHPAYTIAAGKPAAKRASDAARRSNNHDVRVRIK